MKNGNGSVMDAKAPPYSLEAERAVLGCMMIEREAIDSALEYLTPRHFYDLNNEKLFEIIAALHVRNAMVDLVSVTDELKKKELLVQVGGQECLMAMMTAVPTAAHIDDYVRIVREKHVYRRLIDAAMKIGRAAQEQAEDAKSLIEKAEHLIFSVSSGVAEGGLTQIGGDVFELADMIDRARTAKGGVTGTTTGLKSLDEFVGGFQPGNLIIIGARPGIGKTSLVVQTALHNAVEKKVPVALYSLEMSRQEILMRMVSMLSGVGMFQLRMGRYGKDKQAAISAAMEKIHAAPIYMDSRGSAMTPTTIRSGCRKLASRLKREGTPLGAVIVDYIQLMSVGVQNRNEDIAQISRSLKLTAGEIAVPFLVLSQLNRLSEEKGTSHRPNKAQLRDSGALEQDADGIILLWNQAVKDGKATDSPVDKVTFIFDKFRNGPAGDVDFYFQKSVAKFVEVEKNG